MAMYPFRMRKGGVVSGKIYPTQVFGNTPAVFDYLNIFTLYHRITKVMSYPGSFQRLGFFSLRNYFHFLSSYHEKIDSTQAVSNTSTL